MRTRQATCLRLVLGPVVAHRFRCRGLPRLKPDTRSALGASRTFHLGTRRASATDARARQTTLTTQLTFVLISAPAFSPSLIVSYSQFCI